jgi:hypothetical protein
MKPLDVRPDIDEATRPLASALGAKREIRKLPEVLWEGETVEMLATGQYGGGQGLVVMTDKRLLFFKHGFLRQVVEDFPYNKVSSAQWSAGPLMGTLTVFTSGNKAEIKSMQKDSGKALADKLRSRLAGM